MRQEKLKEGIREIAHKHTEQEIFNMVNVGMITEYIGDHAIKMRRREVNENR